MSSPIKQRIKPSLMFTGKHAGKTEEAIHFYTSLFKGSRILVMERYGPDERDIVGTVKFSSFTLGDQVFNAMDSSLLHAYTFTPAVSPLVSCDSEEEIDRLHGKLSEGGVLIPLGKYPYADKYCWVNDRYGVSGQLFFKK
jgi:predicted 3-demethylubiquinone-9 3-methyltransferase (glyoxalase superfamily)